MHGANPYVQTPSDFPLDPAFPYVGEKWRDTTSVYGPAFTLASEPLALADGESADAAAWIYKTLAAVALLAATGLAAFLARGRRAFACAFVGWNPLLAVHMAAGATTTSGWWRSSPGRSRSARRGEAAMGRRRLGRARS